MPVFKREVEQGPAPEAQYVQVKIREEGHGKVSTGKHDGRDGEEYFAEGETFSCEVGVAKELKARYYVDILPAKAELAKA